MCIQFVTLNTIERESFPRRIFLPISQQLHGEKFCSAIFLSCFTDFIECMVTQKLNDRLFNCTTKDRACADCAALQIEN